MRVPVAVQLDHHRHFHGARGVEAQVRADEEGIARSQVAEIDAHGAGRGGGNARRDPRGEPRIGCLDGGEEQREQAHAAQQDTV